MMTERIGNWAWALTPAERLVAVQVTMAKHEGAAIGPGLASCHEAMRVKQAKLLARGVAAGARLDLRRAPKASYPGPAMAAGAPEALMQDAAA